ncbi:MAG: hypothetical protein IPI17_10780 [Nitrosomonas sp.]|jgi:bifunctional pyridoxal-dependent enzyme with beta-cystathionase and maltose regulon repressor activities|nr:hypothetical protein [Nitrosomonas sp.]
MWVGGGVGGIQQNRQLLSFFIHQAGVGLNPLMQLGTEDSGFMQLNIGAPRQIVLQVLEKSDWLYIDSVTFPNLKNEINRA